MKSFLFVAIAVMTGCVHATPAENRTGEDISRAASEATRRDLKEESPALYSTSKAAEPEVVVAPPEPVVEPVMAIAVNTDGTYTLEGDSLTLEQLGERLKARDGRTPIQFAAAPDAPQQSVTKATEVAKGLGYEVMPLEPAQAP